MIRILIVEDQAILRESLARSVGDQPDMTVVAAIADASDALDVALKERPDMILMDVCTEHDSNGIVAAARIKEQLPECRVIIMTGMPEITFVDQAREAGVDSFVYKNVGIDELFAVMRSTLAGYCTFPKPPESIFSGTAALDDVELSILRLACEGKSGRVVYERGHDQAPYLGDSQQDRLRQHHAPGRARGDRRQHRPQYGALTLVTYRHKATGPQDYLLRPRLVCADVSANPRLMLHAVTRWLRCRRRRPRRNRSGRRRCQWSC